MADAAPDSAPEPIVNFNRARSSVAAERNTAPIVAEVTRLLGADVRGRVRSGSPGALALPCCRCCSPPAVSQALEVASGTGQHCAALAAALPGLTWQPSEVSEDAFPDIVAHAAGRPNVRPPLLLDAAAPGPSDVIGKDLAAVLVVNLTHISAWRVTLGVLAGAGASLRPGGMLLVYGPFFVDGKATTESNATFDASLRASNPEWGYRDRGVVAAEAAKVGLRTAEVVQMPANNFLLAFRKEA